MSTAINEVGAEWLKAQCANILESIEYITPSDFVEQNRYLSEAESPLPGPFRFDVAPFAREIVDCFDIHSHIREVNVMKGVKITYTTMLESGILYFIRYVKTLPGMYITADKELADARIDANIIPMINSSGFANCIRSLDTTSKRKTGKTKHHIQWEGGGSLVPEGANNAKKFRQYGAAFMLKDELDGWPIIVGKDGDTDLLTDDRCSAYWAQRKIFRGSTPLIKGQSKIETAFKRGDQRYYYVRCIHCGDAQILRWSGKNTDTNKAFGIFWEYDQYGQLLLESVRYICKYCGGEHFEHDKERLFSPEYGAEWRPTARPVEPYIRSYHLSALYSPIGMQPWYKSVGVYLAGYDDVEKRVKDIGKYQVFYNNILGTPFEVMGSRVAFSMVSGHRRTQFTFGQIPNEFAELHTGSRILFLTCTVDVHKSNIAVAVIGWTVGARNFLIEYRRFYDDDCSSPESHVWESLRELIEETEWTVGDLTYRITITGIDSRYAAATVLKFCDGYQAGVYPIIGVDRPAKVQQIKEFAEFKTQSGSKGYKILVDHYKDRISPVLRRDWTPEYGEQREYHFNAPMDCTDKQLRELTVEVKREKIDDKSGLKIYEWHRPGNVANELWDLLVYAHAMVEIYAWIICTQHYNLETVDWDQFWALFQ